MLRPQSGPEPPATNAPCVLASHHSSRPDRRVIALAPAVKEKHLFRLAYGVLALAFWVSVAGFAYVMTRDDPQSAKPWSAWRPKNNDLIGAREIGQHVSRKYHADTGKQLVVVQEHPPEIQGLALEAIGIRQKAANGQIDPYVALYGGRRTLIYAFCGLGQNCSVPGLHTPSRDRLLRREALELALYSFKYLEGIDTVVSLLPPTATAGPNAVFFRKDQIEHLLQRPLNKTLKPGNPPRESRYEGREAKFVEGMTANRTFPAKFEALPDGDAILVLELDSGSGDGSDAG
jgi:hypothetical protein